MPPSNASRRGVYVRSGPERQNAPAPEQAPVTPHKGWPFAQGSQNHLDDTQAPWPRPSSRNAPAALPAREAPDQ